MASAGQAGTSVYPGPPSFSQNSTESGANGISHSQSGLNSFDGAQSLRSTPTPTPPASRHQQNLSYGVPGINSVNGSFNAATPRRNDTAMMQPQARGQIYTAVYSGVSVYEMEVNGVAVMRRRSDSWLNATQILKVAGVEKGKRTKVLEKEILSGEHEKVQGGYGRYQGTWIKYQRGVEFARQYGVEDLLRPLFEYDMGQDGISVAGQGDLHTPTKEQAMAAQRKRNMMNGGLDNRPMAQTPNGTFFKNISKSAANAVNAINKARFESPSGSGVNGRPPKLDRRPSQQMINSQDSAYVGSSQQSLYSERSDPNKSFDYGNSQPMEDLEPPRKRVRHESFAYNEESLNDASMLDVNDTSNGDYAFAGLQPLPQPLPQSPSSEKQHMLLDLFLDPNQTDFTNHKALALLSGEDLDTPLDPSAHTALHWAATLARTSLLKALIAKGANIARLNSGGETALIRAAQTTNNLDQRTFPELLELLGPTIEIRDTRGRMVLHHIAVSSAVKGRGSASRYYLESLLEFVVRQGSAPNSQSNSFQDPMLATSHRPINLARFMSDVVNARDIGGDTALNLAARVGNKSIIHQLLEVGANPTIENRSGLRPVDFGVGGEASDSQEVDASQRLVKAQRSTVSKVNENSQDLLQSLTTLLSDTESSFKAEIQIKQSLVDQAHATLRTTTAMLTEERRRLTDLQRTVEDRKALRQRVINLQTANKAQRDRLVRMRGDKTNQHRDVHVGDADSGLEVDEAKLLSSPPEDDPQALATTDASQQLYLASLPSTAILQARTAAYRSINGRLEGQSKDLQSQSMNLEAQLRRVVSLCCEVDEDKVDDMVDGLVQAVESEQGIDVEVGRVRDFLRRVESVD